MSLQIQGYLRSGKTPEDLKAELGIRFYEHPKQPLVGFKYNQIDSPKTHPIVREARGIVLEKGSWDVVAKGFSRFFNVGEYDEEFEKFDWSSFTVQEKEDGSLILLYHYGDEWHVNTSGSFGFGEVNQSNKVWRDLFWDTSKLTPQKLIGHEKRTLVFELCTPYNKIVRRYPRSGVYLLSSFNLATGIPEEDHHHISDLIAESIGVKRPQVFEFSSLPEIREFMLDWDTVECARLEDHDGDTVWVRCEECPPPDPNKEVREGLVLRDRNNQRWKMKTRMYAAMHHMKDNGNLVHPKNLVPIVLAGETAEVKLLMPEVTSALDTVEAKLLEAWQLLSNLWEGSKHLTDQKTFALAIKDHPLASMLFTLRKNQGAAPLSELTKVWRQSDGIITKKLFSNDVYEFDVLEEEETNE